MRTRKANQGTRAVAYIRVSTQEQVIEGLSLDAQESVIRSYCAMRDLELVELVSDPGVTAAKPLADRDGGRRVLELVAGRKVDAVVAFKLDRLFRSCVDCLSTVDVWDRQGVALHLLDLGGQAVDTSSAMGRFFLTVMAGAAEMERNQIRERTSTALQHKRELQEYTGNRWIPTADGRRPATPYGTQLADDGVHLEPDADEQQTVAKARRLRGRGLSLRAVAAKLAERGHLSRTGRPFDAKQISRMIAA